MKAKVQVAKKRSNDSKRKAAYMKRARRGMMGFCITWMDSDPFTENGRIDGGEIDHANPTQKLICRDMWQRCSQLSLIHISEPTRRHHVSRMPSSA